jgi:hypothetical protein
LLWHLPLALPLALDLPLITCHLPCQLPLALPTANRLSTCHLPCKLPFTLSLALPLALPHYATVLSLLLPPPINTQTSFSALYSQASAVYVLPLIWHRHLTKAHNNPKQKVRHVHKMRAIITLH